MTTWFVPGRIEVFGKHTDYAGGNVLVAAVDRGVTATAEPATEFSASSDHGEPVRLDPSAPTNLPAGHWGRYVHTVLRRLAADFGPLRPVAIHISSNLPLASGMSSSSALLIGVALAVADLQGLRSSEAWRDAITSEVELAGYLACIENGSAFKHLDGGTGVGTNGGSEDHAAIICGRDDQLLRFSFNPMRLDGEVPLPAGWTFIVATSGVTAEKTGTALADYNRCSADAKEIVALAQQQDGLARPNLSALLTEWGPDRVRSLVADSPSLTRRLEHFLVESGTVVPSAAEAFRSGDIGRLGELAAMSQEAARSLLGNQVAETTQLVESALAAGAQAATSFGAGFGGSVWALVPTSDGGAFAADWLSHYRHELPAAGARSVAMVARPAAGARRIR